MQNYKYLNNINFPSDIKKLNNEELKVCLLYTSDAADE